MDLAGRRLGSEGIPTSTTSASSPERLQIRRALLYLAALNAYSSIPFRPPILMPARERPADHRRRPARCRHCRRIQRRACVSASIADGRQLAQPPLYRRAAAADRESGYVHDNGLPELEIGVRHGMGDRGTTTPTAWKAMHRLLRSSRVIVLYRSSGPTTAVSRSLRKSRDQPPFFLLLQSAEGLPLRQGHQAL